MVHLIFARRAIAASARQQDIDLEAQRFMWERQNLEYCQCNAKKADCKCPVFTPRTEFSVVQGARRPVELFEYIFPEKSPICRIVKDASGKEYMEKIGEVDNVSVMLESMGIMDKTHYPKHGKFFDWFLDKIKSGLGLKEIPDVKPTGSIRPIHQLGITLYPIGVKDEPIKDMNFVGVGSWRQDPL